MRSVPSALTRAASWLRGRPGDAALAGALCLLDLLMFSDLAVANNVDTRPGDLPPAGLVGYAVLGYLPLVWRRRWPAWVFAALWVHSMVAVAMPDYRPTLGLMLALYTVAAWSPVTTASVALVAVFVTSMFAVAEEVATRPDPDTGPATLMVATAVYAILDFGVWGIGRAARASRQRHAELDRRRRSAAEEAVTAERARIARDLHDIVAHTVTVIVLQAAGARRSVHNDPGHGERTLEQIERLGKQTMGELRRLLTVLRTDGGDADARAPVGLKDVRQLLEGVRRTGVSVTLSETGEPHRLDSSIDLAAYRLVQEALTNVTRHAGPGAAARVELAWSEQALTVRVADDGLGVPAHGSAALSTGSGLLGLRERMTVVGGTLAAGPQPDGGFHVVATLPISRLEDSGQDTA